ncbi:hypothetical protein SAMN05216353_10754 [Halobacillus alkaliphilus]|uniref:Uncharacterized protein n=1 Tax=Halobacillus alkaliphilus TaxID=396056 RepID=A0A1I2L6Y7_9BACI|nr:hypothetical protein SAMN05216353_10754 [Halobacillus alkaliphilus]
MLTAIDEPHTSRVKINGIYGQALKKEVGFVGELKMNGVD